MSADWQPTACILCECNCGIEVQLGGEDGRRLVKVRGDDAHPVSQRYVCEKPARLDYYQNGPHRLTKPLRRRPDGSFEEIDWDTAIREVAAKLAAVRDTYGGETIVAYGGPEVGMLCAAGKVRKAMDFVDLKGLDTSGFIGDFLGWRAVFASMVHF